MRAYALLKRVGGSGRGAWSNPSFGRIFEEDNYFHLILNTPLTHQGGLADLRGLTADAAALRDWGGARWFQIKAKTV